MRTIERHLIKYNLKDLYNRLKTAKQGYIIFDFLSLFLHKKFITKFFS